MIDYTLTEVFKIGYNRRMQGSGQSSFRREVHWMMLGAGLAWATACVFPAPQATNNLTVASALPTASPSPSVTLAVSSKSARFYFQSTGAASFDPPQASGTLNAVGSGLQAVRVYSADGAALELNGPTGTNWPKWISSLEVGVSGSANLAAPNPHCANFVTAAESNSNPTCCTNPAACGASSFNCGAPLNQFRVSEWDCLGSSLGVGGASDGIYIRAIFNRSPSVLATSENILVTVEYTASSLSSSPTNPVSCLTGGVFSPEFCSDFTWRAYLKRTPTEVLQPFLLLVPPIYSSAQTMGTGVMTKQFFLPLASDSALSVFQLSRTGSTLTGATPNFSTQCFNAHASGYGDSPLCSGMVFYSITFLRI
ncbi:MAG: hypothetical protein ACO3A2_05945 [Bdellovibrionia bacterium]